MVDSPASFNIKEEKTNTVYQIILTIVKKEIHIKAVCFDSIQF